MDKPGNIAAFCQHLLRPIKSVVLADNCISVKPKYRPVYRSISSTNDTALLMDKALTYSRLSFGLSMNDKKMPLSST